MKKNRNRILILEDDKEFKNVLIKFFSIDGIQTLCTETIEEAIKVYNENIDNIKLFLIDLWILKGNGMEFLKFVRNYKHPLSKNIPAILMSCVITPDVKKAGEQLGIISYFEKPIDLNELQKVVSMALEKPDSSYKNYDFEIENNNEEDMLNSREL